MSNGLIATKAITIAVAGVTTASGSMSIAQQLSVLYPFLYLQLPLYVFFIMIAVAAFIGSVAALLTDVMENEKSNFKKIFFAFGTGLTSSFIILPSIVTAPTMGILILTALGTSFSGTILVYILAQVIKDKNIQKGVKNSIGKTILYGLSKLEGFVDYLLGSKGDKK